MAWLAYPGDISLRRTKIRSCTCPVDKFDPGKILRAGGRGGDFVFEFTYHWQAFVWVTAIAGGMVNYSYFLRCPVVEWGGLEPGVRTFRTWERELPFPPVQASARGIFDGIGYKAEGAMVWRNRSWQTRVGSNGIIKWDEQSIGAICFPPAAAAVGTFGYLRWLEWLEVEI